MTINAAEMRLLNIYSSGSAADTAAVMRDALPDIGESDERKAALSLLSKLERMGEAAPEGFSLECGAMQ